MEVVPDDRQGETRHTVNLAAQPGSAQRRARRMVDQSFAGLLLAVIVPACFTAACRESRAGEEPTPLPPSPAAVVAPAAVSKPNEPLPLATAVAPASNPVCGEGMALVEGNYCSEVEQDCVRWLDDPKLPFARCADYGGAKCVGERRPMRYCIDQREFTAQGETLPQNFASYQIASRTCKSVGKRLCSEAEWTFACEGEEMRPYPYGFAREPICNYDRSDLYEMQKGKQALKDLRTQSGSLAKCVSPFGVFDMAGNVDEPTVRERGASEGFHNALKGGWWMAARNRCRPATTAHDDYYKDIQIGVRCCADVPTDPGPTG